MSLFICNKCGCVENTALASAYEKDNNPDYPNMGLMEMHGYSNGKSRVNVAPNMLCKLCNTGNAHGEFEYHKPTDVEIEMAKCDRYGIFTNHPLWTYREEEYPTLEEVQIWNHANRRNIVIGDITDVGTEICAADLIDNGQAHADAYFNVVKDEPYTMEHKDRNSKCSCGSGKKYKKCCLVNERKAKQQATIEFLDKWAPNRNKR